MIQKNLAYRLNEKNGNSILFPVSLAETVNGSSWFLSKNADVACLFAAFKSSSDIKSIPAKFILDNSNIRDGAPVVVPGFPMGIRSEKYSNPIVRSGNIASCDSLNTIIDAFVFPGNSGGPVIYVPYVKVDDKTLKSSFLNSQMLIGIVSSYIPYVDVAVSMQTKRPRITFEENTGLCNVVPGYKIIELLNREDVLDAESKIKIIK